MSNWMPIETAPTDGTSVLLRVVEPGGCVAVEQCEQMSDGFGRPLWIVAGERVLSGTPTHWQPLPSANFDACPAKPSFDQIAAAYQKVFGEDLYGVGHTKRERIQRFVWLLFGGEVELP